MQAGYDVIVCGSLHLDIVVNAPALPRIDETAVGRAWKKACGGKGGNQAVQAARAGARTAMIGQVGRDDFGGTLIHNLGREGVGVSAVREAEGQGSGMSVAIIQDDGSYGAVIVSGANLALDPSWIENQWRALGGAAVLVLQNEVPHAVNAAAAKLARVHGAQVIYNAAPVREAGAGLMEHVDVLVVNRVEAEAMCGKPLRDRAEAAAVIEGLGDKRKSVIITLGGEGLVMAPRVGGVIAIDPVPVRVTSTHGAGDCFVGTLAAQLAAGTSLAEACVHANERAAAFVARRDLSMSASCAG